MPSALILLDGPRVSDLADRLLELIGSAGGYNRGEAFTALMLAANLMIVDTPFEPPESVLPLLKAIQEYLGVFGIRIVPIETKPPTLN